jgi:hypothetical protein
MSTVRASRMANRAWQSPRKSGMATFCAAVATSAAAAACPVSRQATHANAMAIELRQARATSVLSTKCSNSRLACEEKRDENINGMASIVPLGRSYFSWFQALRAWLLSRCPSGTKTIRPIEAPRIILALMGLALH